MKKGNKSFILLLTVFVLIAAVILVYFSIKQGDIKQEDIRESVLAGSWYPANQEQLENLIGEYLNNSKEVEFEGKIKAVIVPHAGYIYSGVIAASAFKQLNSEYENIFLIGPSHNYYLTNVSVSNFKYYSTPLGNVKVSEKAKNIAKEEIVKNIEEAHSKEHSLEIELPFLQTQLKEFEIVPLLVGQTNTTLFKDILDKYVDEQDLIVLSVDLSHYHEYTQAITLDSYSVDKIMNLDSEGILNAEIDSPWAVSSLLKLAKEKSWKPYIISYTNSGDITGNKTGVVGYSAIVFVESFSQENIEFMLNLARESAESYLKDGKKLEINEKNIPEILKEKRGCFVTFTKDEQLRGCVGNILPQRPIYECIIENSINAAINDQRFSPVNYTELKEITMDVSILSVPVLLEHASPEDLLLKLKEKKHGVVLIRGNSQSTFLPSVWEFIPDKKNFLANLCVKAEMEAECWKDMKTGVYVYEAVDFSE